MRCTGHVERTGEKRIIYTLLVGKQEGKRPPGRTRHRWVDNSKMNHGETGLGGMDWIDLGQDRDQQSSCEHGNDPLGFIICREVLK
jgi:hypothetical protein